MNWKYGSKKGDLPLKRVIATLWINNAKIAHHKALKWCKHIKANIYQIKLQITKLIWLLNAKSILRLEYKIYAII